MSYVIAMFAGFFAWTFIEYAMHHWNGHLSKGKLAFSKEHLAHHRQFDYESPWQTQVKVALPILITLLSVSTLFVAFSLAMVFTLSVGVAFRAYSWLHNRCHDSAPKTAFGHWARRHHFYHHFTDAKYNHGVTSPLWDHVFRTYRSPGLIVVPPRKAMPWLLDEAGEVKPEYSAHYTLRTRRKRERAAA